VPVFLYAIKNNTGLILSIITLAITTLTLIAYYQVALTNPGYIKGNKDDVE